MVEKNMQSFFSHYMKTHLPKNPEVYELKICKQSSIPFNALQPHQEEALVNASTAGLFYKIPDQPVSWGANTKMRFSAKKPFDCLVLAGVQAFVVLWFYHERQPKVFIKIPILSFQEERASSTRKSLTEERAREIGIPIYL